MSIESSGHAIRYVMKHPGVSTRDLMERFHLDVQQAQDIIEVTLPFIVEEDYGPETDEHFNRV